MMRTLSDLFLVAAIMAVALTAACGSDGGGAGGEDVAAAPDVPIIEDVTVDDAEGGQISDIAVVDLRGPDVASDDVVADVSLDISADISADAGPIGLPRGLPFSFTREDEGTPLSPQEVREFTARLTAFWKERNYFRWVLRTTSGMDDSTGMPGFRLWWADADMVKEGDRVTFLHCQHGGDHNIHIETSKVLSEAMAEARATGDPAAMELCTQFCNGFVESMKGMVYDEHDPIEHLMARNVYTSNHEYVDDEGHDVAVDYSACYSSYETWNTNRFEFPNNPTWGDVWVTNERSKDDVCHIFRMIAFLPYLLEDVDDPSVQASCGEAWRLLQLFAKDIVDHDWYIRTKGPDGEIYIPTGQDKDLASLKDYVGIDPRNECPARMGAALIGYGEPLGTEDECEGGVGSLYDGFATVSHYFNYDIIRNFHMASVGLALMRGQSEAALQMLAGLAERADLVMHPRDIEPGTDHHRWDEDVAVFLMQSASVGLPLTSAEARKIQRHYDVAVASYADFDRWDIWDPAVSDGTYRPDYGFRPERVEDAVRIADIFFPMEYCASPFRNPDGRSPVDCDIILNPDLWGTTGDAGEGDE